MNEHIQNLLQRQYSEDVKDEAISWVLFNGESAIDVAEAVDSTASATINLWAIAYHRKIEDGLITLVPMKGCSFNSNLIILTTISCIKSKKQKNRNPLKTSARNLHISPAYTKQPVNEHFALLNPGEMNYLFNELDRCIIAMRTGCVPSAHYLPKP